MDLRTLSRSSIAACVAGLLLMIAGALYMVGVFQHHADSMSTLNRLQMATTDLRESIRRLSTAANGATDVLALRRDLELVGDALEPVDHPASLAALEHRDRVVSLLPASVDDGAAGEGGSMSPPVSGERIESLRRLASRLDFVSLVLVRDEHQALDRRLMLTVVAYGGFVLLFGLLCLTGFAMLHWRIRGPVEALSTAAREFERGNTGGRSPLSGVDELASVSGAFNAMMIRQRRRDEAVQAYEESLSRTLAERTAVLDALPAHIALLDAEGNIRDVNTRWRQFARENGGTDPGYGIGRNYPEVCEAAMGELSEEGAEMAGGIREVLAGRRDQFTLEYPCHSPQRRRWFRAMVTALRPSPVDGAASVASGAVVIHIDITERRFAEEELRDQARLMRIAGRIARFGGWSVDLGRGRVIWSDETAAIHDMPAGHSPTLEEGIDYYAEGSRERVRACWKACVEHGVPWDEELQLVTARGRRVQVRSVGEPVRDETGRVVAVQGAFQDVSDIVAARERSRELARRLVQTLESISDAFFILDPEWRFTFMNPQAEQMLDRHRADLIGEGVWEEFPEAVGSTFEIEYRRAVETGETVRFSEFYPPLGKWFEVNAYPTPEGLAVYFRDVTDARARNEQLHLLETAVSRQNDILLITESDPIDAPGGPEIVYANDAFFRRTGYTWDEVIGRTPRLLQGPKTSRSELDRIRDALQRWQPVRAELINYTRSGEEMWLELDIVPISNTAGQYTHWVAVERDIGERKLAEEAVRVSDERFRLVTLATNDVIWDWDLATDRIWWSENLASTFGYERSDAGTDAGWWVARLHPDDRDRVVRGMYRVIDEGDLNWADEYRFLNASGQSVPVMDRGFVIRNDAGEAARMVGSMLDVSERQAMDERLREAQKLEAMGQLTGGVAHDFNNLLTVILGNAEELTEDLNEQRQLRTLAEMITRAAQRGAELTNRLLAFARRQALDPRPTDINRLVRDMDGLLRRALGEDVEIETASANGLWLAEVDPGQLEVALLNLAINARDAMPEGGRLTIETANTRLDEDYSRSHPEVTAGPYVTVSVSDTGSGMSEETIEQAFEPFFTTKQVGRGSGLGLSMVYGFVKQSGGHARIYSETGEGTAVRLYFPRATTDDVDDGRAPEAPEPLGGGERILVVEDDELVRAHVVAQLRALGYRISAAEDGPQALAFIRGGNDVDLLFTDVVMPGGMNGPALAEEATALCPGLRVLFTSGYTENAIVHHGRLDRGVHLLGKPYRRAELAAKVREVLESPAR